MTGDGINGADGREAGIGREPIGDRARLIRAGADGELTAGERAEFDRVLAECPDDASRVEFERSLRAACGKAMRACGCPAELRAKIEAMAPSKVGADDGASVGSSERDDEFSRRIEARGAQTRDAGFWSSWRRPAIGMAAAVLLTASAVLVWQSAVLGVPGSAQNSGLVEASFRQTLTEFVTEEHDHCRLDPEHAERKFVHKEAAEALDWFKARLGDGVHLAALDQPIEAMEFLGAGGCAVPGGGSKSAHMQFDVRGPGDVNSTVSIFAAPRNEYAPLVKGTTYAIDTAACGVEGFNVLAWTDGVVNYYLVSDAAEDRCVQVIRALGLPSVDSGL